MGGRGKGCPSAKAGGRSLNLRCSESNSQETDTNAKGKKDKKAQTTKEVGSKIIRSIQSDEDLLNPEGELQTQPVANADSNTNINENSICPDYELQVLDTYEAMQCEVCTRRYHIKCKHYPRGYIWPL